MRYRTNKTPIQSLQQAIDSLGINNTVVPIFSVFARGRALTLKTPLSRSDHIRLENLMDKSCSDNLLTSNVVLNGHYGSQDSKISWPKRRQFTV